ncbi:unnamed protein product [Phytophthora lilii]|uniref:Unnamed protein product n=1 Tax=Phytophthora lilii TaxID=2077276 RepID=A0A9W7D095_9STRA|nr:unnamed protein product [Phytophthora lilii]GMF47825.1 unnamed protein product [Phytophthora lilii]
MPSVETQQVSHVANSPLHTQPVSPTLLVSDPDARIVGNRATHHTIEIPPPQATYPSEKEAIAAIQSWSKEHGFNMTKRRAFYIESTPRTV